mgnify:FL=1
MDGNIIYKTHTIIRNVAIFVSVIIFYGCSQNRTNLLPLNIITSDSIYFSESTDILSQDIIDSIYWIPLDSSHINIFDHISKMCVVNDYILIASRNQSIIQVYSKKGNFLYQISNKGNGPKDYLEIATFTATNTSIYALDNYTHKISQYNINTGEFIKKTDIPFTAWDMEAFDDNDFIFSCLNNNPEASINTNPINYSVWRTNNNWEFTHFYLPFEQGYTEFYGKPRYFTRSNNSIIFHALKYNGYFILEKHGNPSFSSIIFNNPLPKNHSYRLMDVNKNHWQFLAETPFKINGYGIFEISSSGESEQLFSVDSSHKIYRNSSTNAKYLPINIIGTTNDSFIGYINDDYNLYQNLVRYGFKKADEKTDSILKNGGCSLIIYQMKK